MRRLVGFNSGMVVDHVVGVEEVQDRLLEEVCFFFGWLHGYFVGWLVARGC